MESKDIFNLEKVGKNVTLGYSLENALENTAGITVLSTTEIANKIEKDPELQEKLLGRRLNERESALPLMTVGVIKEFLDSEGVRPFTIKELENFLASVKKEDDEIKIPYLYIDNGKVVEENEPREWGNESGSRIIFPK